MFLGRDELVGRKRIERQLWGQSFLYDGLVEALGDLRRLDFQ